MESRSSIVWLGLCLLVVGCAGTSGPRQSKSLPGDFVEPSWVVSALPLGADGIRVSWGGEACTGGGCRVERAESTNGPWTEIARPGPDETRLEDRGLSSKVRYHYRLVRGASGARVVSPPASAYIVSDELPLADWINVADHAICVDGDCDWSATLQKIIDEQLFYWRWGTAGRATPHVVYFPEGVYELRRTVFMEGRTFVRFQGASRGGVVLKWAGEAGTDPEHPAIMFHSDGNTRSVYRNLIWDGGAAKDSESKNWVVAFDQSFCGNTDQGHYNPECDALPWTGKESPQRGANDTGSMHLDSEFRNAYIGLRIGHYNVQTDEQTIRRCRFLDNFAGVSIEDSNALSLYFWDDEFAHNRYGITNDLQRRKQREDTGCAGLQCATDRNWGGDYRVLRGRFRENYVDAWVAPTGEFTFRDCWSRGSGQFIYGHGQTQAPGRISVINCQVDEIARCRERDEVVCYGQRCDPAPRPFVESFDCSAHEGYAIEILNAGPLVLLDNRIDSTYRCDEGICSHDGPIFAGTWVGTDVLAVGNGYTVPGDAGSCAPYAGSPKRVRNIDDHVIEPFDLSIPDLPQTSDPFESRPIYTATEARGLQALIDLASLDPRPAIVHLPSGAYVIEQTLKVAAGSDLILAGNGPSTELRWGGEGAGPILEIDGADAQGVTLRDLKLRGHNGPHLSERQGTCLSVRNVDRPDSAVLLDRVSVKLPSSEAGHAGLILDRCDRAQVDLTDFQATGDRMNTGLLVLAGHGQQVPKAVWTGTMFANAWGFDVVNGLQGVRLLISSTYAEDTVHYLRAGGSGGDGEIVIHGGKMAIEDREFDPQHSKDAVVLENFPGRVSLVGMKFIDEDDDFGARLLHRGANPLDLALIGNSIWEEPEFEVGSGANVLRAFSINHRTSEKQEDLGRFPRSSGAESVCVYPENVTEPEQDHAVLKAGLELLRDLRLPHPADEQPATDRPRVYLVDVVADQCKSGIVLTGDRQR